jgi:hypothetical protein
VHQELGKAATTQEYLIMLIEISLHVNIIYIENEGAIVLVSSPDPTAKRRKGSGTHRAVSGLADMAFLNTDTPHAMWLTCDYHVTPRYTQLLLRVIVAN